MNNDLDLKKIKCAGKFENARKQVLKTVAIKM